MLACTWDTRMWGIASCEWVLTPTFSAPLVPCMDVRHPGCTASHGLFSFSYDAGIQWRQRVIKPAGGNRGGYHQSPARSSAPPAPAATVDAAIAAIAARVPLAAIAANTAIAATVANAARIAVAAAVAASAAIAATVTNAATITAAANSVTNTAATPYRCRAAAGSACQQQPGQPCQSQTAVSYVTKAQQWAWGCSAQAQLGPHPTPSPAPPSPSTATIPAVSLGAPSAPSAPRAVQQRGAVPVPAPAAAASHPSVPRPTATAPTHIPGAVPGRLPLQRRDAAVCEARQHRVAVVWQHRQHGVHRAQHGGQRGRAQPEGLVARPLDRGGGHVHRRGGQACA